MLEMMCHKVEKITDALSNDDNRQKSNPQKLDRHSQSQSREQNQGKNQRPSTNAGHSDQWKGYIASGYSVSKAVNRSTAVFKFYWQTDMIALPYEVPRMVDRMSNEEEIEKLVKRLNMW